MIFKNNKKPMRFLILKNKNYKSDNGLMWETVKKNGGKDK
jgi:hypothetical protein